MELTSLMDLWGLLGTLVPEVIICERFRGGVRSNPRAFEVIGVLKLWSEIFGGEIVFLPPPRGARSHKEVAERLLDAWGGRSL